MIENHLPRLIDETLTKYFDTFGAVLIKGPKWCGKTTTVSLLEKLFIIEVTKVFATKIRLKTTLRTSNKRGFTNTSSTTAIPGL